MAFKKEILALMKKESKKIVEDMGVSRCDLTESSNAAQRNAVKMRSGLHNADISIRLDEIEADDWGDVWDVGKLD